MSQISIFPQRSLSCFAKILINNIVSKNKEKKEKKQIKNNTFFPKIQKADTTLGLFTCIFKHFLYHHCMIFRSWITSLFLCIFGLFLGSPTFAVANETKEITILSGGFSDTCTWNIQCEKLDETRYVCRASGEVISNLGNSIHHIPVGKYNSDALIGTSGNIVSSCGQILEKRISYIEPDTFVYPFVRITKIQV